MLVINTANLCFDFAGLTVTLTVLWLIYRRLNVNSIFMWMLAGAVLHIATLSLRIYLKISGDGVSIGTLTSYRICIFAAHILYIIVIVKSVIYAGKVTNTDSRNRESFNIFIVGVAFMPMIVSAGCRRLWNLSAEGFAASVTVSPT